jgi:hypothetical protein
MKQNWYHLFFLKVNSNYICRKKTELKRSLDVDATSLVAGSMIGSRIFIVTSAMARDIGYCPVDNMGGYGFYY